MTRNWPVLTTALALVFFAVTPMGWELIGGILSGGLSGSIAGFVVLVMIMPILLVLGLLEWLMWRNVKAPRNFPPDAQTTTSGERKPDQSEA
jgi:cytochrome c oxidase assembly factor CtaG